MPPASPLQQFVDDELARAGALIERCVAGTLSLLRDHRDSGLGASEREHHFELVEALQRQHARYQGRFIEALRQAASSELPTTATSSAAAAPAAPTVTGLELMDESRVAIDIEISRAMQIIDSTAEWELRELQTFTSTLCGMQHVSAESNPLRPLVYATALWEAACAVVEPAVQRAILLRVSAGVMAGLLKNAWAAASTRLEAQGVQPGIYRTVLLAPGSVPGRDIDARAGTLGALLERMPALADAPPGATGAALVPDPGGPVASQPATDGRVVGLLSRLFTLIQADTQVPSPFRAVIARLQVAALGVALREPAMLDSTEHPVWLLMNRIATAGAAFPSAADRRHVALLSFCEALAEEISRAPSGDVAPFRRAQARLDAFTTQQLQWQLREAQATVMALQRAERREVLEQVLSQRLSEQMASVRTSAPIRRFVTGAWAKVLAESMVLHGEQTEPTPGYLKTVDDLLWSVQTPDHPQSRQRLLALLPGLLQRLRSGMALIALPAAEQQAVLDALMLVHTEALRPGQRASSAPLTPEQIVQSMRDEVVPDTPAARPFSDSVIDLTSMDTVPADFLPTDAMGAAPDEAGQRIDALAVGQRHRLFLRGRWSVVQLLWRSERGLFFLYAGEQAGSTHSITRRALERLDAAGLMRPLESQPLVKRTADALANQLSLAS